MPSRWSGALEQERIAARKAREEERKQRAREPAARRAEEQRRKIQARAKALAARAKARAARVASKSKVTGRSCAAAPPAGGPPAEAYIAPVRTKIKDELAKLMPMVKRSDLTGLDYWALYTMHSEIVKYGRNPEELARKFVKGYGKGKKKK